MVVAEGPDDEDDEAVRRWSAPTCGPTGGASCLLAPVGVDREVLGYLVVLRDRRAGRLRARTRSTRSTRPAASSAGWCVDARLAGPRRGWCAELRELDRYKGELIATISHELKTPLTSIIGHTELLEEAGVQPSSVSAICRNAARLDRLVTNLLNYSRIQGRRELAARCRVDLVELCRSSLEMLRIQADAAGVDLELHLPDGPVLVMGDAEELPKVVDNLCSNAVKYTPRGGRVEVHRPRRRRGRPGVGDATPGSASRRRTRSTCSRRSTAPPTPTRSPSPAPGSGWRSRAPSRRPTAATILVDSDLGHGSTFTLSVPLAED